MSSVNFIISVEIGYACSYGSELDLTTSCDFVSKNKNCQ